MRLCLSRIPFAARFGRRRLGPFRPRLTVRALMAAIALLAVVLGGYLSLVEMQERRLRFRRADRAVRTQFGLLRLAAAREAEREGMERQRAAKSRGDADIAEREAAKWPEASEERQGHLQTAALWRKVVGEAARGAAAAAKRSSTHRTAADSLAARRLQAGDDLAALERLARSAELWLTLPGPREDLPQELAPAMAVARAEWQVGAWARTSFPTVAGPRASAVEATAIWSAEQFLKSSQPGLVLDGYVASASQVVPTQPFWWKVKFVDPKTAKTYEAQISMSDSSVNDYLAKNP